MVAARDGTIDLDGDRGLYNWIHGWVDAREVGEKVGWRGPREMWVFEDRMGRTVAVYSSLVGAQKNEFVSSLISSPCQYFGRLFEGFGISAACRKGKTMHIKEESFCLSRKQRTAGIPSKFSRRMARAFQNWAAYKSSPTSSVLFAIL